MAHVKEAADQSLHDLCARHLVEMAAETIMLHLLQYNATQRPDLFSKSVRVYANLAEADVAKHHTFVMQLTPDSVQHYM